MNALYRRLLDTPSGAASVVPPWVVKAFVIAWFARTDLGEACARAHFGLGLADLGPGGVDCARKWASTLRETI